MNEIDIEDRRLQKKVTVENSSIMKGSVLKSGDFLMNHHQCASNVVALTERMGEWAVTSSRSMSANSNSVELAGCDNGDRESALDIGIGELPDEDVNACRVVFDHFFSHFKRALLLHHALVGMCNLPAAKTALCLATQCGAALSLRSLFPDDFIAVEKAYKTLLVFVNDVHLLFERAIPPSSPSTNDSKNSNNDNNQLEVIIRTFNLLKCSLWKKHADEIRENVPPHVIAKELSLSSSSSIDSSESPSWLVDSASWPKRLTLGAIKEITYLITRKSDWSTDAVSYLDVFVDELIQALGELVTSFWSSAEIAPNPSPIIVGKQPNANDEIHYYHDFDLLLPPKVTVEPSSGDNNNDDIDLELTDSGLDSRSIAGSSLSIRIHSELRVGTSEPTPLPTVLETSMEEALMAVDANGEMKQPQQGKKSTESLSYEPGDLFDISVDSSSSISMEAAGSKHLHQQSIDKNKNNNKISHVPPPPTLSNEDSLTASSSASTITTTTTTTITAAITTSSLKRPPEKPRSKSSAAAAESEGAAKSRPESVVASKILVITSNNNDNINNNNNKRRRDSPEPRSSRSRRNSGDESQSRASRRSSRSPSSSSRDRRPRRPRSSSFDRQRPSRGHEAHRFHPYERRGAREYEATNVPLEELHINRTRFRLKHDQRVFVPAVIDPSLSPYSAKRERQKTAPPRFKDFRIRRPAERQSGVVRSLWAHHDPLPRQVVEDQTFKMACDYEADQWVAEYEWTEAEKNMWEASRSSQWLPSSSSATSMSRASSSSRR